MSPKRAHSPGASSLVALLILGLAGAARAASYNVRPAIEVEQTHDDNVLSGENEAGKPKQEFTSWGTRIAPSVSVTRKTDVSEISLLGEVSHRTTYNLSDLDGTDRRLGGRVVRTLTPRLSVGASADYWFYASYNAIEEINAAGRPQVLFDERPEVTTDSISGDFKYVLGDATELTGEADYNDWKYGSSDLNDLFDSTSSSAMLTLSHQLTARDKVGATVSYGLSKEKPSEPRDLSEPHSTDRLGLAMGSWQRVWSPNWSTNLQAGVRILDSEFEQKRALNGDFVGPPFTPACVGEPIGANFCIRDEKSSNSGSGLIGGASINHAYSSRGQVSLGYTRDTRTGMTSSTGSSAVDTERFSATVVHKLSSRVALTLDGSYYAYETSDEGVALNDLGLPVRSNNNAITRMHLGSVRVDWQLRQNTTAYATFSYFDFDQQRQTVVDPDRNYSRRIYSVGFRYFFDLPDREP